jgi:thioredoxin-related protein
METFIADFPRQTQQPAELSRQNEQLAQEYGVSGFPTVMIVNPDGSVIKKTGYVQGGAENYVEHLKGIIE